MSELQLLAFQHTNIGAKSTCKHTVANQGSDTVTDTLTTINFSYKLMTVCYQQIQVKQVPDIFLANLDLTTSILK